MSQNNSNDKAAMLAKIEGINKVDGFDPTPFAVDYTDLETGEVRKRLPVMIQMAWFRMKYPEGRIAVTVSPGKDCFVATAKVYPSYKDGAECYLAEATASRGYLADKPSVSPREWAQTAAVGIALRNAGFGLQFAMAGDEFEDTATDELNGNSAQAGGSTPPKTPLLRLSRKRRKNTPWNQRRRRKENSPLKKGRTGHACSLPDNKVRRKDAG